MSLPQKTDEKDPQKHSFENAVDKLLWVMACLRDPDGGCPWDIEQTFETIVPYTIEEAYEVADAIDRSEMGELKEELGDLLLQVVYHARMAEEDGHFNFSDVAQAVADKMIYRHPHVFGDESAATASDVNKIWDQQKDGEKELTSALDGVTKGLPALLKAHKLQKKAAKAGYEWPDTDGAFTKLEEEINEFKEAVTEGDKAHIQEEYGDLLFCLVNFARMNGLDSEETLRQANAKFERRFRGMEEDMTRDGCPLPGASLDQMLAYWKKQKEK